MYVDSDVTPFCSVSNYDQGLLKHYESTTELGDGAQTCHFGRLNDGY